MTRFAPCAAFLLLLAGATSTASAEFVTAAFSYRFADGQVLSGTVQGIYNPLNSGQLINLTNLHATYSGRPGVELTFLHPSIPSFIALDGRSYVSFSGFVAYAGTVEEQPNFGFSIYSGPSDVINSATIGTFSTSQNSYGVPDPSDADEAETFARSRFSAQVVPEPASISMAAMALVSTALLAVRRRNAAGRCG
ncbi:PEP-CTERM sorting domain-containing protein [Paludisphaera rhizosphaerae]|uniref:PEP-CTERM sorting domain-containing protein n=1 Tax=Paludisphaera rhizosphaerae TaxID=2711216 RepID=UPI0013EC1ECF|nr:PEP-CTERM sorting domain-containing protein [Paludisphaera rhizosphaerae]